MKGRELKGEGGDGGGVAIKASPWEAKGPSEAQTGREREQSESELLCFH